MMRKKTKPATTEERDPHPTMNKAQRQKHFYISEAGRSRLTKTNKSIDLAMHQRAVDIDIEKKQLVKELLKLNGGRMTTPKTPRTFQDDTHIRGSIESGTTSSKSEVLHRRRRSRSYADIADDIKKLGDIPEVRSRTSTPVSKCAPDVSSGFTKRTRSISTPVAPFSTDNAVRPPSSPRGRAQTALPHRLQHRAYSSHGTESSTTAHQKPTSATHNSIRKAVLRRSISEGNQSSRSQDLEKLQNTKHSTNDTSFKSDGQTNCNTKLFSPRPPSSTSKAKIFEKRSHTPLPHGRRRSSSLTDVTKFQEIMELREGHIPSVAEIKNELRQKSRIADMVERTSDAQVTQVSGNRRRSSSLSDIEKFRQMQRNMRLPSIVGLPSRTQTKPPEQGLLGVSSPQINRPRTGGNRRRSSSLSDLELYQLMKKDGRSPSTITGRPHHMEERALDRKRSDSIYQARDPIPHGTGRRRSSSLSDVKLYQNTLRGQGVLFEDREHEDADSGELSSQFDALQDCAYLRMYIPKYMR